MEDVTIVSALFNIERENMDGRDWEKYLKWFDLTLKLKCPMVLFVTEDLKDFVDVRRKNLPTKVIIQKIDEIPYYNLKEKIDCIISSEEYKKKVSDPNRIECQHSMYSIIQYSKFEWLKESSKINPFNSQFFFWLDAGASRFFENYDLELEYPSPNAIDSLKQMGDKFLIQMNMEYYKDLAYSNVLTEEYLLDNRSYILGSMFGGGIKSIEKVSLDIQDILINKMIYKQLINNEQIALGYLVKNNFDDYEIYERYNGKHAALFGELSKR